LKGFLVFPRSQSPETAKELLEVNLKWYYYICPNQEILTQNKSTTVGNNNIIKYHYRVGSKACNASPLRDKYIPKKSAYKTVTHTQLTEMVEAHVKKMQTYSSKNH